MGMDLAMILGCYDWLKTNHLALNGRPISTGGSLPQAKWSSSINGNNLKGEKRSDVKIDTEKLRGAG